MTMARRTIQMPRLTRIGILYINQVDALLLTSSFSLLKPPPFSPAVSFSACTPIMYVRSSLSRSLLLLVAAPSFAAADPIRFSYGRAADINHNLPKRQDPAASCTDALCVLSEALATLTTTPPSTTTADPASTAAGRGANVRVSVAQPSLCSESALQFSSSWSVPTGIVQIHTETGWGVEGSIWNITANDGVQLANFRVPCQGSSCTGITGNKEGDGDIFENPDGSWSMNVTANMQPSVAMFGDASGGTPSEGTYDLSITSTPPCALPVFQNCSTRDFDPTADQWEAYSTGDFLLKYLKDNNINSLSELHAKASNDFLPTIDAQGLICNPDAGEWPLCKQWCSKTNLQPPSRAEL